MGDDVQIGSLRLDLVEAAGGAIDAKWANTGIAVRGDDVAEAVEQALAALGFALQARRERGKREVVLESWLVEPPREPGTR